MLYRGLQCYGLAGETKIMRVGFGVRVTKSASPNSQFPVSYKLYLVHLAVFGSLEANTDCFITGLTIRGAYIV